MTRLIRIVPIATLLVIFSLHVGALIAQSKKPISKNGLLEAIRLNGLSTQELVDRIQERGVNFQLTSEDEKEFQQAGARPELIAAVKANYRVPAAPPRGRTGAPNPGSTEFSVPSGPPLTQNEVVTLLQSGVPPARVEKIVEVRGVDFTLTPEITSRIKSAGGTSALIGIVAEKSMTRPEATSPPSKSADVPDYDDLMDQATSALSGSNWNYAISLLQRGIQTDPSKPTAYSLLGYAQLYGGRNINAASEAGKAAIDRGGRAVFRVYHDHDGYFNSYCTGSFFVSKEGITFKADNGVHTFEARSNDIREAKLNGLVGAGFGAFHVKMEEGGKRTRNYNFAPATGVRAEANLILDLIQGSH